MENHSLLVILAHFCIILDCEFWFIFYSDLKLMKMCKFACFLMQNKLLSEFRFQWHKNIMDLGDLGSILDQVIPKNQKIVLDTSLLNTQHYKRYRSRVKCNNPGKGVVPFPTLLCSSYWKGSLRDALDHSRTNYILYICIYIYIYIYIWESTEKFLRWPRYTHLEND